MTTSLPARREWQPAAWVSGVWLIFLVFPILSVWTNAEITTAERWLAVSALVLFGIFNIRGERTYSYHYSPSYSVSQRQPIDSESDPASIPDWLNPQRPTLWFSLMVTTAIFAAVIGGLGALGAVPFLVTFAVFVFSWRTAITVFLIVMATVIVLPLVTGQFEELWFFIIIVGSVGGTAGMFRYVITRAEEFNTLQTELLMSEERSRVARDVHDVLGHSLTAIVLKTQVTDAILAEMDDPDGTLAEARSQVAEMHEVSRQALAEIRTTVTGLRTGNLAEEVTAARSILSDAGVELSVHGDADRVPDDLSAVLGWVVREAVTNVVRHADASTCTITVDSEESLLSIADNGVGATAREGNGLTGLRERLAKRNLALRVSAENGTRLSVVVPEVAS